MHFLLTQNRELRRDGIFAWTLPALAARLPSGQLVKTCPQAGVCAALCYARNGTFNIPTVKAAHLAKLTLVVEDLAGWTARMQAELSHPRYAGRAIRIHDAGDFFSRIYAEAWLSIIRAHPGKTFYAYTKEVGLFQQLRRERRLPANLTLIYSLGGRQDHLINRACERHAEVFPSLAALVAAGYQDQSANDLLAATLPTTRIGIVANNIAQFRRRMGAHTFGDLQQHPLLLAPLRVVPTARPARRTLPQVVPTALPATQPTLWSVAS